MDCHETHRNCHYPTSTHGLKYLLTVAYDKFSGGGVTPKWRCNSLVTEVLELMNCQIHLPFDGNDMLFSTLNYRLL